MTFEKELVSVTDWIKNWFENESGGAKGAVLGVSGGKDSTVVAALLCRALGPERVLGILMPNGYQKDIGDSRRVCELLNLPHRTVNIEPSYHGILEAIAPFSLSPHTRTNILPRLRMTVLYAAGQELSYRVAGTGNLSERMVGYATKWGDMACDFNPVANFTTDEVIGLGRAAGLPEELLLKPPADGLTGLTDEENLGFSYEELNRFLRTGKSGDDKALEKINQRVRYSAHKLAPIPCYSPDFT